MAAYISKNDRLGSITSRQEFKDFSQFILPVPKGPSALLLKLATLSGMAKMTKTWNVDDMADGLNRMIDIAHQGGRITYDIWSKEDKAKDPGKKETVLFHFPAQNKSPFVLVCAGGAYMSVASLVEGFPVAAELNRMGYSAFVLHYRCGKKNPWPTPLEDMQQALHFILNHADEFNVERENYAVAGFSAGGHMTASLGTENFGYKKWNLSKPGALFLAYPVTMYKNMTKIHKTCRDNIIGKDPTREQIDSVTVTLNTSKDFPPTYLMHCKDDDAIYFENSEKLAEKLKDLEVPCALKEVPTGGHGIGLGNGTQARGWFAEAVQFWQSLK